MINSFGKKHDVVFSVILPTYNRSYCIIDAIESVLHQTYNNYEIIVIDDGSDDDTKEILEKYNEKIKYLYQENKGVSSARNLGISQSSGKYIAFIDSDDLWTIDHLEKHYNLLENNLEYVLSYNYAKIIDFKTGKLTRYIKHDKSNYDIKYPETIFIKNNILTTPSVVIRRCILDETGVFDEGMNMCEDLDLWRRISITYRIKCLPEYLTMIRERENQFDPTNFFYKRRSFLEKAISEDANLNRSTITSLYYELYETYYSYGCNKNVIMQDICTSVQKYPELIPIITKLENNQNWSFNANFNAQSEKEAQLYYTLNLMFHFKFIRVLALDVLLPFLKMTLKAYRKINKLLLTALF